MIAISVIEKMIIHLIRKKKSKRKRSEEISSDDERDEESFSDQEELENSGNEEVSAKSDGSDNDIESESDYSSSDEQAPVNPELEPEEGEREDEEMSESDVLNKQSSAEVHLSAQSSHVRFFQPVSALDPFNNSAAVGSHSFVSLQSNAAACSSIDDNMLDVNPMKMK